MERPYYEFDYAITREVYLFVGKGKHGNITKMVKFQIVRDDIANLGFGDCNEDGSDFDDLVITDNGDMEMVLATFEKNVNYEAFLVSKLFWVYGNRKNGETNLGEEDTSEPAIGRYNPELDKYVDVDLFPEKTAKAREMLKNAPLPPELLNRKVKN